MHSVTGGTGAVDESRVTAVFYTCCHVEKIIGAARDGEIGGILEGLERSHLVELD